MIFAHGAGRPLSLPSKVVSSARNAATRNVESMTRLSGDQIRFGRVWNGFDYDLQVWVVDGIIQLCGHPHTMRSPERSCCNAYRLAGQNILGVPDAQIRENGEHSPALTKHDG